MKGRFGLQHLVVVMAATVFLIACPNKAKGINKSVEDPFPNTASIEIEKAIAKGKELLGRTDYYLGGGHGGTTTRQYNSDPPQLDCSSFVHWAYNKGAGMLLSKQVLNTTGFKQYFRKYLLHGVSIKDAKRGDLVYLNGGTHIVIWLGGETFLGMQGSGAHDPKGGAQITTLGTYWKWDGDVIRITKDSEGVLKGEMEPLKNPDGVTGNSEDPKIDGSEEDSLFKAFNPFIATVPKSTTKGVNTGDEVISHDAYVTISNGTKVLYKGMVIIAMVLSAGLVAYTSIMVVWYFALLPRNGVRGMELFEKLSGVSATISKSTTFAVLGRWGISVMVIGLVASKAYVWVMVGTYKLVLAVTG